MKKRIKRIQAALGVEADGVIGPKTLTAIEAALYLPGELVWPTQGEVRSGESCFGVAGDEGQLVSIKPPYPLYYEGREVKTIRVHRLVAGAVEDALEEVLRVYGLQRVKELRLDQYGGSYNFRKTGSGKSLSMHAWGIALDFDPDNNTYGMHKPVARMSGKEYEPWWEIWEKHGAVSLGRERDYDWMHLQFARL